MPERFTETLRAASEAVWSHAVQHRFVNELIAGTVPDAVMARYLIQDHRFLDSFLILLGAALASADTFAARLRFGRFIGMVSAEENTYFLRAFEALGVTETRRAADPDTQPTPRCEEPLYQRWQHLGYLWRCEPDIDYPGTGTLHRRQHQKAPSEPIRLNCARRYKNSHRYRG